MIRFTPRQIRPIAGLKGYGQCTGGWYVLTASRGRLRYRIALDARSLKIAARIRIGVNRQRIAVRRAMPTRRSAATPVQRRLYRPAYRQARSTYRWSDRGGHRPGMGRSRRFRR